MGPSDVSRQEGDKGVSLQCASSVPRSTSPWLGRSPPHRAFPGLTPHRLAGDRSLGTHGPSLGLLTSTADCPLATQMSLKHFAQKVPQHQPDDV